MMTHEELATWTALNIPMGPLPGWADPVMLFACECGKVHLRESGKVCECGREFPYQHRYEVCR